MLLEPPALRLVLILARELSERAVDAYDLLGREDPPLPPRLSRTFRPTGRVRVDELLADRRLEQRRQHGHVTADGRGRVAGLLHRLDEVGDVARPDRSERQFPERCSGRWVSALP
jgi:hypothetical protein